MCNKEWSLGTIQIAWSHGVKVFSVTVLQISCCNSLSSEGLRLQYLRKNQRETGFPIVVFVCLHLLFCNQVSDLFISNEDKFLIGNMRKKSVLSTLGYMRKIRKFRESTQGLIATAYFQVLYKQLQKVFARVK